MQDRLNTARLLYRNGNYERAAALYRETYEKDSTQPQALYELATICLERGNANEALDIVSLLTEHHPTIADVWNLRANILLRLDRFEDALTDYEKALAADPTLLVALLGKGDLLAHLGRHDEALKSFHIAQSLDSMGTDAAFSRGNLLLALERLEEAENAFRSVLIADPRKIEAHINLGIILAKKGRSRDAIRSFDTALSLSPDDVTALYNRGNLMSIIGRFEEAAADCSRIVELDPETNYALGNLLWAKLQCCDWTDFEEIVTKINLQVDAGKHVINPQQYLNVATSPESILRCAESWAQSEFPPHASPLWRGEIYEHDTIRIAYLSADFSEHATAHLITGMLERHDRKRFRTHAISLAPDDNSAMRARLRAAFDTFVDAENMGDAELASLIRDMEIDILVDLKGYTNGARTSVLAMRPAPLQVSYLGYPGTTGANYIDYVIADRWVVPSQHFSYFSEEIVWLPDTYQCNDDRQPVRDTAMRTENGLPQSGFVFCCFNAIQKILPTTYNLWMRILARQDDSVLWLLDPGPTAMQNLRAETERRGVNPERLVFAEYEEHEAHLSRLRLADLVLDTLPYNAHTTAADALWAGVPVLTLTGSTFPGRVASSLLHAIGMTETIADTPQAFEEIACRLASDATALTRVKEKLAANRETFPLFDTARFTRNFESALITMWNRYRAAKKPKSFAVEP